MKINKLNAVVASLVLASTMSVSANAEVISSRVGKLEFNNGYPTQETMENMINEMDFQRATQLYMWGVPLSGIMEWMNANRDEFGLQEGQMSYYFTRAQKQGIITSNFTTPYICGAWNLDKTGPIVIELPEARMAGKWQDR